MEFNPEQIKSKKYNNLDIQYGNLGSLIIKSKKPNPEELIEIGKKIKENLKNTDYDPSLFNGIIIEESPEIVVDSGSQIRMAISKSRLDVFIVNTQSSSPEEIKEIEERIKNATNFLFK
jgi:hypothetical protein